MAIIVTAVMMAVDMAVVMTVGPVAVAGGADGRQHERTREAGTREHR